MIWSDDGTIKINHPCFFILLSPHTYAVEVLQTLNISSRHDDERITVDLGSAEKNGLKILEISG